MPTSQKDYSSSPSLITKGSCLCSSVLYETHGEPLFSSVCHCTNCQKFGGSAMAANIGFLSEQVKIKDPDAALKPNEDHNTYSGQGHTKYFCSRCGSSVFIKPPQFPGMSGIMVVMSGTVDDLAEKEKAQSSRWTPQAELFCGGGSKRSWFKGVQGVPEEMCFEEMMAGEALVSIMDALCPQNENSM